ncbi:MAG: hypothetical protein M4579_000240 [Chaenotheca gracillima]|nr:MAG: hypothetical protein M4579_000240 [Chaenotheca gracillima]
MVGTQMEEQNVGSGPKNSNNKNDIGAQPTLPAHPTHVSGQHDLERGIKPSQSHPSLHSTITHHTYNSSPSDAGPSYEWGPSHPCFPHLNPHVPTVSAVYAATRIIRIQRDWLIAGDLGPQFSNVYPEILDPLIPEQAFRQLIDHLNTNLLSIFDPRTAQNWTDVLLGAVTGWVWDDLGFSGAKRRLETLENWLEDWNRDVGAKEGVRIWPLRRTAYMSLDIQIPDPQIGMDASEIGDTRPETGHTQHNLEPRSPALPPSPHAGVLKQEEHRASEDPAQ